MPGLKNKLHNKCEESFFSEDRQAMLSLGSCPQKKKAPMRVPTHRNEYHKVMREDTHHGSNKH